MTQNGLEKRKFRRSLAKQVWEEKAQALREFSSDLALWFYLFSLESYEPHPEKSSELEELTQKLVRTKSLLVKYPKICARYEQLSAFVEEPHATYLEPIERENIKKLVEKTHYELLAEADKISL